LDVAKKTPVVRIALTAAVVLVAVLAPSAIAAPGGSGGKGGGKGGSTCTQRTPAISIDNNWQWGMSGSWGMPGQTLTYSINVINYDIGCGSSSFSVNVSTPSGFSVSIPTNTITLRSSSSGYVSAYVTSPTTSADGDYPLTVTIQRTGTSNSSASGSTIYKVYSTDTSAPLVYWPNPAEGTTISGGSYQVIVSSSDDHAVKKIDLYIDNAYMSTSTCADIAYDCQLVYKWSLSGAQGQHTATFKSYDWMGNVGVLTTHFTVG
jgi:Bacterial Ig domain